MKRSVRTKFWLIFMALALGPLILLGFLVIRQSYVSGLERASFELRGTTRLVSTKIEGFFDSVDEHLHVLLAYEDSKEMDRTQRDDVLSMAVSHKHKDHSSLFTRILLVSPDGETLSCASLNADCAAMGTMKDMAFLKQGLTRLLSGRVWYGSVMFDHETGEPLMQLVLPVMEPQSGKLWAVLLTEIRLKEIWNVISEIQADLGTQVYLTNRKGRVIGHANPSVVLKGSRMGLPLPEEKIVRGMGGKEVMMVSGAVSFGNRVFYVVTEKPLSEVLKPTYALIWKLGSVFVLALIVAVFMGLMTQRLIVIPLEVLARKARKIGAGDLEQRPSERYGPLAIS
ncbi:MAG: cache domain-containing protein [Deltaproteobacteria bacterium]|jgi:hypothetical protein|nr:cache domain-containing protein [Deltaproteobacteria bacterium]